MMDAFDTRRFAMKTRKEWILERSSASPSSSSSLVFYRVYLSRRENERKFEARVQ